MVSMKITIDESKCIGCGACAAIAPAVFIIDTETGKAKVSQQPQKITAEIQAAIDSCPTQAIKIVEEEEK